MISHGERSRSGLLQSTEVQPLRSVYLNAYLHSYGETAAKTHISILEKGKRAAGHGTVERNNVPSAAYIG